MTEPIDFDWTDPEASIRRIVRDELVQLRSEPWPREAMAVAVAQSVERRDVAPAVEGSSPSGHPTTTVDLEHRTIGRGEYEDHVRRGRGLKNGTVDFTKP